MLSRAAIEADGRWIMVTALISGIASAVCAIAQLTGVLRGPTNLPNALRFIALGVIGGPMFAFPFRAIMLSRRRDRTMSNVAQAPVRVVSPLTPLMPLRRFVIESPLPLAVAHARLAAAVEPKQWLRFGGGERPFEGRVDETSFEIWRIIGYGNSSRPAIRGTLVPAGNGTTVEGSIMLSLSLFARIFLIIWFGGVLVGCIVALVAVANGTREPLLIIPFAVLAVVSLSMIGGFAFEVRKALRELGWVFGADT
jgi:hypothetical protein